VASEAATGDRSRAEAGGGTALPLGDGDPDGETYYQVLGVPYAASAIEISRAYRAAMKRIHPDRQGAERRRAAEEAARRLNEAYATLSRPDRRLAYDRTIRSTIVQDQIMGRYVGGFYVPQTSTPQNGAVGARREPTPGERRERARADRAALVSIVAVFGGLAVAVIVLLVLWSLLSAAAGGLL
jgi:DnaJ-domain-containing protein 1